MESLESRVSYLEKLVRTQTDRIEMLANVVDGLIEGFEESNEEEESSSCPSHMLDFKPTCDFTDQRKIDDCGVQIDFNSTIVNLPFVGKITRWFKIKKMLWIRT